MSVPVLVPLLILAPLLVPESRDRARAASTRSASPCRC
jgi:hypothetical protein